MIINGKSAQGIFLYSRNLEFERNDFVVSGNSIYICTAKYPTNQENQTVSGEDPKVSSRNFKLYPEEMISSKEEFDDYIKLINSDTADPPEDKLISSYVVAEVLQSLHFGLSTSGIIDEFIEDTSESPLPLDDLIKSQTINNGTVYISPNISQIQDILPIIGPVNTDSELKKYNLVLRQYTYIGEKRELAEDRYIRVQELINPYTGYTAFRYTTKEGESGIFGETISTWRSSYTYSGVESGSQNEREISDTLHALDSFYTTRMNQLSSELDSLRGSFRFRKLNNPTQLDKNIGVVTLTIASGTRYITCETISYDFTVPDGVTSQNYSISLTGGGSITVTYGSGVDNFVHLSLSGGLRIIDAYKREYYGS